MTDQQTIDTFAKFIESEENNSEIADLRNNFRWANKQLRQQGITARLQWVYAQGRPCSTYRYHLVFDYDKGTGPNGCLAQGQLTHVTFDELLTYFKGLTTAFEIR